MDDNVPAFPTYEGNYEGKFSSQGLTRREYYAALAMQGMLANSAIIEYSDLKYANWIANLSFWFADAMIKESGNV